MKKELDPKAQIQGLLLLITLISGVIFFSIILYNWKHNLGNEHNYEISATFFFIGLGAFIIYKIREEN